MTTTSFSSGVQIRIGAVKIVVELMTGVGGEKFHRQMNPVGITTRQPAGEVVAQSRAATQHDGIKIGTQFLDGPVFVFSDENSGDKFDAFFAHQVDPTINDFAFVEFHVGDAVHEQPTDPVRAFKNDDVVTGLIELVGAGESGRTGADDGDFFAGAIFGNVW